MSKPLDTRIVDKARLTGGVRLDLNLQTTQTTGEGEEAVTTTHYLQQAVIDYELLDADGKPLGRRSLTHQLDSGESRLTWPQAYAAVGQALAGWVTADRLALADNDAD